MWREYGGGRLRAMQGRLAALWVATLSRVDCAVNCPNGCGGTNVVISSSGSVVEVVSNDLPFLPPGTETVEYSYTDFENALDDTIVFGGPMSLNPGDSLYSNCLVFRRSQQLFARWLNAERGGIQIGAKKYGVAFQWVGDGSSPTQVANSTAHALRRSGAHFAVTGFSSGTTVHAAKQSYADGKVLVSAGAASTAIFVQNALSFGLIPSTKAFTSQTLLTIAEAAAQIPCGSSVGSGCKDEIVVGFIKADYIFTNAQCSHAPTNAADVGLTVVSSVPHTATVGWPVPTEAEMDAALTTFRDAGVNVIVGCTCYPTAIELVKALERIDYNPYAVLHSNSNPTLLVSDIQTGLWQGEFLLGPAPWHTSRPGVGALSGLTSEQYFQRYADAYGADEAASYWGAWNFGVGLVYMDAIERAQSLDSNAVAQALRDTDLEEFMGRIKFDQNNQNDLTMLAVQVRSLTCTACKAPALDALWTPVGPRL